MRTRTILCRLSLLALLLAACNGESTPPSGEPDVGTDAERADAVQDLAAPEPDGDLRDVAAPTDLPVEEDVVAPPVDAAADAGGPDLFDAVDVPQPVDAVDVTDASAPVCGFDFDCEPGERCEGGGCIPDEPVCGPDRDCPVEQDCVDGRCVDPGTSPHAGRVRIGEVLIDGNTDEDANGDGSVDAIEDAFVELVSVWSGPLDLGGWTLVERHFASGLPRHTFADGTLLAPGRAIVVFGGGAPPDETEDVLYLAANAADVGDAYGLDLDGGGDRLRLLDAEGRIVAEFAYGDAGPWPAVTDESLTRSPELLGDFLPHTQAEGADGAIFSPGTRADGRSFR